MKKKKEDIKEELNKLLYDNYSLLIKEGVEKEKIDELINGDKEPWFAGNSGKLTIEEMVFVLETLKVFDVYDQEKSKIKNIKRKGGDFFGFNDGPILGYKIEMEDGEKYTIVLDDEMQIEGQGLEFGATDDKEQHMREQEMLKKFVGFGNNVSDKYIGREGKKRRR